MRIITLDRGEHVMAAASTDGEGDEPADATSDVGSGGSGTGPSARRRWDVQWLALGVSVLVGGAGLVHANMQITQQAEQIAQQGRVLEQQDAQLRLQQESIDQAEEQLALSRGGFETTAGVNIWDTVTQTWGSRVAFAGQRLGFEAFADRVYIILTATNIGLSAGYIAEAGVLVEEDDIASATVLCPTPEPGDELLRDCEFPVTVEAQAATEFYIRVDEITGRLECNDFVVKNGLVGAVRGVVSGVSSAPTTTFDPFSNDCAGPVEVPTD